MSKKDEKDKPDVFSRVRFESMRGHLKAVYRATANLDDLLEETTEDNGGLQPHDLAELLESVESLQNACDLLVRRGRTLAQDRIQAMAAPEHYKEYHND